MSILQIRAADLPALMSGQPAVLAPASLPGVEKLALPGLALWLLARREDRLLLLPPGAAEAAGPPMPLALPPAGALALLATTEAEVAPILAWWQAASGQPAPLLLAADAAAALPALLARLLAELQDSQARAVQLERSLVETRLDYEETRIAIAAAARSLGHRPPAPLTLALALEPAEERLGAATEGARLFLRQPLARSLDGLAALALHIGAISAATTGPLRLRIRGEESGRIAASWTVEMAEVTEGWLTLDLPTPLAPVRETAVLEISADVAGPHSLGFSLDRGWVPAEVAVTPEDGSGQGRALALRIWTAGLGGRFVVPAHWNWDEVGASLPLTGVPQAIAPAELAAARGLSGAWDGLRAGLSGTGTTALLLPRVSLAGADVLRLGWSLAGTARQPLRLAAFAMPPGQPVTRVDSLSAEAGFSGWREIAPGQQGALTLLLPVSLGPQAQIVLAIESADAEAEGSLTFTEASLLATRDPAALRSLQREAAAELVPPVPRGPSLGRVELLQHLVSGRYQHLDLLLHEMEGGGQHWPQLRFKLAIAASGPLLEFRRARGWPEAFARWPGTETDQFGPVLRLRHPQLRDFVAELAHPRDAALAATLLALLEPVAAEAVRLASLDEEAATQWRDAAVALREA
ncbi:DUF6212 domain-containing protein [Falsiroseomonas sp.]|uniref:DUF6212 domain-containing protein n=1 Tax=Falsiroseomonas sp. TaxID=2870721 RepID=UPI003F702AD3